MEGVVWIRKVKEGERRVCIPNISYCLYRIEVIEQYLGVPYMMPRYNSIN